MKANIISSKDCLEVQKYRSIESYWFTLFRYSRGMANVHRKFSIWYNAIEILVNLQQVNY
jgi:hypothetical protein